MVQLLMHWEVSSQLITAMRKEIFPWVHPFLSHQPGPQDVSWPFWSHQQLCLSKLALWVTSIRGFLTIRYIFSAQHWVLSCMWGIGYQPHQLSLTSCSDYGINVRLVELLVQGQPSLDQPYLSQSNSPPPSFIYQKKYSPNRMSNLRRKTRLA
jgi:hypothetical protein